MQKSKQELNANIVGAGPVSAQEKGITLIALIITIIVMLILVGVTINVALNGGLFTKAETATRETEEKAILEEMLAMMEITDKGKINYSAIITKMKEKYGEEKVKYTYPNATITGKLGTYNYIVSETEIKIETKENIPVPFDWSKVGFTVETDIDYIAENGPTLVFTSYGKLKVIVDNQVILEIDATNPDNIDDETEKLKSFPVKVDEIDGMATITMNENEPEVYVTVVATIDGTPQNMVWSCVKAYDNVNVYSNEEVLKMLGITNSTGTYTGTWTVLEKGVDGKPTKLVSTRAVTKYILGYADPKAIEAISISGTEPTKSEKVERAIWSYKNVVTSLNAVAQEATGIKDARSIKLEDIYDIIGEENVNKGTDYGTVYNYYFDETNKAVYSKYKSEEGSWSDPYNTEDASQTFVNNNGNKVVVDSEGDEITLRRSYYFYNLTEGQKAELGSLASDFFWLASPCMYCSSFYAGFQVFTMNGDGIIDGNVTLCNSDGSCLARYEFGVRAVISI